ncbi:O-antigen ligase family protein [Rhodopirellula sp. MGV]|uniref:O-antigen ligase family protein n=1 Tax=Rhodopirellula sp. MGV TaxID=2023130 RepID=UPI000B9709E3|nr:O-antigen ligase family protein [Rhodopirellula sp. MGV]OYP34088.1 hypothetical protein CGZ80_16305 [Rhodopirellula sp. MGV]PNY35601.1 hypothetical protein C2E31_17195 [Rhodopirellula baltica]
MTSQHRISAVCQTVIQCVLVGIVLLSPWPFGSVNPDGEFGLTLALSIALLAFVVRLVFGEPPQWKAGRMGLIVVLGLIGLVSVAALHQIALPASLVNTLAPGVQPWSAPIGLLDQASSLPAEGSGLERWEAGNKLGLYAHGSYQFLLRVVAAGCLFAMTCCFDSPRLVLRRISVAATVVGVALAIFGIAQHVGSHDGLVYWTYKMQGGLGFGPFINRNHYPFYLNLCLGLAIGLLLDSMKDMGRHWPRMILSDRSATWLLLAITFMIASLIMCVSRGGILTACIAVAVVGLRRFEFKHATRSISMFIMIGTPVLLFLIWAGFSVYESRLTMLSESDSYASDGRWVLWRAAVASVPEFPWFGSGGETYRHWEKIYVPADENWTTEGRVALRADNELLDVLNEYGLAGFVSLLLVAIPVCWVAYRTCRRDALSAGAAIGVFAVSLHSIVDFGLRLPATGAFAVIVAALLCSQPAAAGAMERSRQSRRRRSSAADPKPLAEVEEGAWLGPHFGFACRLAIALLVCGIAIYTIRFKRRYWLAESHHRTAMHELEGSMPNAAIKSMSAAVKVTPEDMFRRIELIRTCILTDDWYDWGKENPKMGPFITAQCEEIIRMCPIAWEPYVWIARYPPAGMSMDAQLELVLYGRVMHPGDPKLAFVAGNILHQISGLEAAIPHWKQSMDFSNRYVAPIVNAVGREDLSEEVLMAIFPDDPKTCFAGAVECKQHGWEEPFQFLAEQCLRQLSVDGFTGREFGAGEKDQLRSEALWLLGQKEDAVEALLMALNEVPDQRKWRTQAVRWMIETGDLEQATWQLRIGSNLFPEDSTLRKLQQELSGLKAEASSKSN